MDAKAIDPRVLANVVVLLADFDDSRMLGHVCSISTEKVLAYAWNPARLRNCTERLLDGETAPTIHVSRYWLHGVAWYVPGDGNHRTVAARNAGRKRIKAKIGSETECKPEAYLLDVAERKLWQKDPKRRYWMKLVADSLSDEVMAALRDVGVMEWTKEVEHEN